MAIADVFVAEAHEGDKRAGRLRIAMVCAEAALIDSCVGL